MLYNFDNLLIKTYKCQLQNNNTKLSNNNIIKLNKIYNAKSLKKINRSKTAIYDFIIQNDLAKRKNQVIIKSDIDLNHSNIIYLIFILFPIFKSII